MLAVGLLWAPATFGLMTLGGVDVSFALPVWVSMVFGLVALGIPTLAVRAEAAERRRSFLHALGCFLDLVAVRLAGGAGVDSALAGSSAAGDGWAFAEIRHALAEARLRGEPSWNGLAALGDAIGITELQELAASAGLAGDEGARVRLSIAAKARSIRLRGLASAEASAQSASERMSLPVVLLMTGFIVFLGYPAIAQVINGL
jgi:tight adherence protein C